MNLGYFSDFLLLCFCPKIRFSSSSSFYGTAIFVTRLSLALAVGDVLAHWEAFFDFSFMSYSRFCEGTNAYVPKLPENDDFFTSQVPI